MKVAVMCRVTDVFAFGSRNDTDMIYRIENGSYIKTGPFSLLSQECQDFIQHLLMVDPLKRYSAEEALNDPWFMSEEKIDTGIIPFNSTINDNSKNKSSHRMNG